MSTLLADPSDEITVDNFAGGGGASYGIECGLGRHVDFAINHDAEAVAMHRINHPNTTHLCESVWDVDPRKLVGRNQVGLGWFSPDCTYHSKARGGKPFRDRNIARRRRGLAWLIPRWIKAVRPRVIMMENVEEFADWGPLLPSGVPDPAKRGLTFRRWHREIENLGYQIDMRELRAMRYGAPTTRKRLFVIARCDRQEIVFPEATHGHERGLQPYRTAAECIDWSIPCPSIFTRDRPLAEATMRRIARGVMRYVVNNPQPFLVTMRGTSEAHIDASAHSVHGPLGVISAQGTHHALVTPFLTEHANASTQRNFRADEPLRTQYANVKGGHFALVAPTLINTRNGEREGQAPRVRNILEPYPTVTAAGSQGAVVAAFLAKHYGGNYTGPGIGMREPLDAITTVDHHALVHAFLLKYYGTEQDPRLERPLDTVTTKDRFGLVMVHGEPYRIADIGMRMLAPRELYRAQSFPDSYIIDPAYEGKPMTKTSQVRMCGNSVCPVVAEALVRANVVEQRQGIAA
jgi:DNA (cytosine-5)-methyltransferase 1